MSATVIRGGTVFDGTGSEGVRTDLRIEGDRIVAMGPDLPVGGADVVDATGLWITPGFIDLHTHYDAEVEVAPALSESVRHGVTTILLGSCGLSMVAGRPVDLADMFCRVEGIPRSFVLPLFERLKTWDGPAAYLDHLRSLPLGPNIIAFLGHSTIRTVAMGIDRALDATQRPTEAEFATMERMLHEALDAGYLGLSINTLPWDKMDGDSHRSSPLPSTFATWSEYRRLAGILRVRGRILQGVPNLATKLNIFLFALISTGVFRRKLKTTIIALMDPKADRLAPRVAMWVSRLVNRFLGADFRYQALPNPFDLWTDGLENPVIEEIGAGTRALHEVDEQNRAALLKDPAFRQRFRKEWRAVWPGRAYHRRLNEARVVDCPDAACNGKTFAAIAAERGADEMDTFLDLQAEHGNRLRWYTVVANDRPAFLETIMQFPDILIGFSDAGAHLRNMAYYNFPLRLLYRVKRAGEAGTPFMSVGRAVHRLTGEIADWLGIDAGRIAVGKRADLVLVRPAGLTEAVEGLSEEPVPGVPDLQRLVRRNDDAVAAVYIGGRCAWTGSAAAPGLGTESGFGRVLTAQA